MPQDQPAMIVEPEITAAEVNAELRAAFAELPPSCRQLLSMLISDPPRSYAETSAALAIPIGSIDPQHARGLDTLRRSPALAAISDSEIKDSEVNDASANETGGARRV
jgi:DNA-directed RNA polymerase specialized sigma24 family protein